MYQGTIMSVGRHTDIEASAVASFITVNIDQIAHLIGAVGIVGECLGTEEVDALQMGNTGNVDINPSVAARTGVAVEIQRAKGEGLAAWQYRQVAQRQLVAVGGALKHQVGSFVIQARK